MQGKLSQLKWTSEPGITRDLVFVIVILTFGVILVMRIAPYYQQGDKSIVYNEIRTTQSVPKSILERLSLPFAGNKVRSDLNQPGEAASNSVSSRSNRPSVIERPLFDGQMVLLRVRSLNPYRSSGDHLPFEALVLGPITKDSTDTDFTPAMGAKLIGSATPDLQTKKLMIRFSELQSPDGRTYSIQGQVVDSAGLAQGIDGNYSSGLPSRILGIALDRTITAADQIGTAYLFSAIGPQGVGAQELKTAAMETNQQASQNISAETTKSLRETPPEISLPAGSTFLVQIRAATRGDRAW